MYYRFHPAPVHFPANNLQIIRRRQPVTKFAMLINWTETIDNIPNQKNTMEQTKNYFKKITNKEKKKKNLKTTTQSINVTGQSHFYWQHFTVFLMRYLGVENACLSFLYEIDWKNSSKNDLPHFFLLMFMSALFFIRRLEFVLVFVALWFFAIENENFKSPSIHWIY